MIKMLIVDDRANVREDLKEWISLHLPDGAAFQIEECFPLESTADYPSYIAENGISVLLLDERLNEVPDPASGRRIGYLGHDVIQYMRGLLPDFPVYMITTHVDDAALLNQQSKFEAIINRSEFEQDPEIFTERIARAARGFQKSQTDQLNELSNLTMRSAQGERLSDAEKARLVGIRTALGLPFTEGADLFASDVIADLRQLVAGASDLLEEVRKSQRGA